MTNEDMDEEEMDYDFSDEDDEEASKLMPVVTEVDGIRLPDAWGHAATSMDEVSRHRQSFNLKHGMFANVPMICKGTECPMHELCDIPIRKRPVFKRCPIEIAAIIDRYDKYASELGLGPEDYFDQSQVKDLIDIEVKLLRTNGHLAISGHFIQEVVAAIDDKGNVHTRPELNKATEYEEKLLARKSKILADLNSTRRAKNQDTNTNEASSFASDLMRRAQDAQKNGIIEMPMTMDVYYEDDEDENEHEEHLIEDGVTIDTVILVNQDGE